MLDTPMLAGFSGGTEHGNPAVRKSGVLKMSKSKKEQFREWFDSLTKEEQDIILEDHKKSLIKKEYDFMVESARALGYTLWSHSAHHTQFTAQKDVLEDGLTLSLTVFRKTDGEWWCKISNHFHCVTITSSEFAFPHDNFKDVFERQVMAAAVRCKDLHP